MEKKLIKLIIEAIFDEMDVQICVAVKVNGYGNEFRGFFLRELTLVIF